MRRSVRLGAAIATVAAAALVVSACSGGGSASKPTGASTLSWGSYWGFETFDPTAPVANAATSLFLEPVYDTLVRTTSDGQLVPMLATDWSYDASQTTLTMNLRTDVTFTDGEAFDAAAVKANIDRTKAVQGPAGANVALVKQVVAVDTDTVEFQLSAPDPGLLDNLSSLVGMMVAPKSLASSDLATNPIGTGPYLFDAKQSVTGDTYTYEKNPDYWDPSLQKFDKVVGKVIQDPVARLNAIKSGQVNATIINPPQMQEAKGSSLDVLQRQTTWRGILVFDTDGHIIPALGDVRVRQAIAYAIDRDGLVKATVGGSDFGAATSQSFSPATPAYDEELDDYYTYNPDKAKQLLAEAGYSSGLTLDIPDTGILIGDAMTAAVKQQLGDVGITVNYIDGTLPVQEILTKTIMGAYTLALGEGSLGTPWSNVSTYLLPSSPFNPFHISTPEADKLVAAIVASTGDAQTAAYRAYNRYVVENALILPFFRLDQVLVTNPQVTVTPNALSPAPGLFDFAPAS